MDKEAFERIKDGDKAAFDEFANSVVPGLYRAAYRILHDHDLCEDAVQITLIKFLDNVGKIKPESIWGWLYKVLSNFSKDELRKAKRKVELREEIIAGRYEDPTEAINKRETAKRVGAALTRLGRKSRAVVLMRMDGFSYSEIAQQVGTSKGSAKVLFLKSIRKLANIMEEA